MIISEMVKQAFATAVQKGWHSSKTLTFLQNAPAELGEVSPGFHQLEAMISDYQAMAFGARMALVTSEVSEALEAYRKRRLESWTTETGKPEGVAAELADVLIRIGDLCGFYGIDLEKAVKEKMTYNETRSYRHGGKTL